MSAEEMTIKQPDQKPVLDEGDVLDADVKEEPIKIKKDGVIRQYVLRELDGPGRKWWQKIIEQSLTKDKKGQVTGANDVIGLQHKLIARTMIDCETGAPVTEEFVRSWGTSTQLDVFMRTRKLSGLDKEAEDSAKND